MKSHSRDWLPTVLIALLTFVVGLQLGKSGSSVAHSGGPAFIDGDILTQLTSRFGSDKFSQGPEEWILRELLDDKRNGVFVDVGAFDAVVWSNTYRLERDFGWSGLAIDAQAQFAQGYSAKRPSTTFAVAFVTDKDQGNTTLNLAPDAPAVASKDSSFPALFSSQKLQPIQVPNRTLSSLLAEHGITAFDLLSMDIELGEPDALREFPLKSFEPAVVVVEAHGQTRQWLLEYFAGAGYVLQGRYLHVDPVNLYFAPRSGAAEHEGRLE